MYELKKIADVDKAYRKRSMPPHSLTIASQNPLKKARADSVFGMLSTISAISVAKACCTSGLSDIQKPKSGFSNTSVEQSSEELTVEYAFPKLRHLGLGHVIVRWVGEEDSQILYCLVPNFLVLLPSR